MNDKIEINLNEIISFIKRYYYITLATLILSILVLFYSPFEFKNSKPIIFKYNIEGLILSNTSDKNREDLLDTKKNEKGGLSGKPIQAISSKIIKCFYREINKKIPIIGVGGVDSGASAFDKITSGANAIQLYTGMVYNGPGVVSEIKKDLISILKKEKIKSISDAVGINA